MAKKIKKQIIRSIPLFVILSLITSSVAVGLVFNFDWEIYKMFNEKDAHLALTMPEAQAQDDTATTTVEVQMRRRIGRQTLILMKTRLQPQLRL